MTQFEGEAVNVMNARILHAHLKKNMCTKSNIYKKNELYCSNKRNLALW